MKKIFFLLLLLASFSTVLAQAQREVKEPRVRFGIGYRHSLALREQVKIKTPEGSGSAWSTPDEIRGGELLFEGTVRINRNWNTGLGMGYAGYNSVYKTFKVYAKGERLYGRRASRWFNYADLGATLYPDQSTGLTAELGGGYRIAITRRTRLDCTLGFEYLNLVGEAYSFDTGKTYARGSRFNRFGFTVGVAMHF